MTDSVLHVMAERLGQLLLMDKSSIVTAESCTAGGLAEIITRIPGSSQWFERGFVTYSDISKQELLGVSHDTLEQFGAVSEQTACAMAEGALLNSHARISVSITGIAGPDGGSEEKPVGTVCLAWMQQGEGPRVSRVLFEGDRLQIRRQACLLALQGLIDLVESEK